MRWDKRRLDAYVEYAATVKEIHALLFRLTAVHRPGSMAHPIDPEAGMALLAQAEERRTQAWEKVLMLGDTAAVVAGREWRTAVRRLELFARGIDSEWDQWDVAVQRADSTRDQFYVAARESLAVSGGSVAQSPWLASRKLSPEVLKAE